MFSGRENLRGKANVNMENLFVQVFFERKRRIVEQIKRQVELYDQHLASKCILAGVAPPPWLCSPSQPSQTSQLNKKEIISGLLFPQSRPSNISFSSSRPFSYQQFVNNPLVEQLPEEAEKQHDDLSENLLRRVSNHSHEQDANIGDVHEEEVLPESVSTGSRENQRVEDRLLDATSSPGRSSQGKMVPKSFSTTTGCESKVSSLECFQRSKSRQKALVLRSSSAKASKSRSNCRNELKPSSPGGNIGLGIASLRSDSVSEIKLSKHDENDEGCRDKVENSNSQKSRFSRFPTMSPDHRDSHRKRSCPQPDYKENSGSKRRYQGDDNRESLVIDRDDTVSAKVDEQVDDHPQSRSCNETAYLNGRGGSKSSRHDSSNREHKNSSNSVSGTGDRMGCGVSAGGVHSSLESLFGSGKNAPAPPADTLPAVNADPSPEPVAAQLVNAVTMSSDHRDSHSKRSRPHSDFDENGERKRRYCGDDNRDSLVIDRDDTVSATVDEQVDDPQSRNCNETPDPSWLSHESKSLCQDSSKREHKKSSNSVSGTGDRMGHGVSADGGKSSLGSLFGSGEAPNDAPAETMPVVNADPSPKPSGINSSSANNFLKQDSASIKKHLVSEFIPIDGCPVGTLLTESPDQVLSSEEENNNPPENAETQLLIPEENDAAAPTPPEEELGLDTQPNTAKTPFLLSIDELLNAVSHKTTAELERYSVSDPPEMTTYTEMAGYSHLAESLLLESNQVNEMDVSSSQSIEKIDEVSAKVDDPQSNETAFYLDGKLELDPQSISTELFDGMFSSQNLEEGTNSDCLLFSGSGSFAADARRNPRTSSPTEKLWYRILQKSSSSEKQRGSKTPDLPRISEEENENNVDEEEEEEAKKLCNNNNTPKSTMSSGSIPPDPLPCIAEKEDEKIIEDVILCEEVVVNGDASVYLRNVNEEDPLTKFLTSVVSEAKIPPVDKEEETENLCNNNNTPKSTMSSENRGSSIPPDPLPCIAEQENEKIEDEILCEKEVVVFNEEEDPPMNAKIPPFDDTQSVDYSVNTTTTTAFIFSPTCSNNSVKSNKTGRKKNAACSSSRRRVTGEENKQVAGRNVKPPISKANKLSSLTTTLGGPQLLPVKEPPTRHNNNIVTNITSFVPLLQQQQKPPVTGVKREVKVKALEAAEATRRIAEQRENDRKMRKEAMKLEMEKKKKKEEEEEARNKKAEMGYKQKEEMEKKKKKRKEIEMAQDKNKKLKRQHREEEEEEDKTKLKEEAKRQQQRESQAMVIQESYDISPYKCSDDEEEEDDDNISNKKFVPAWASKSKILLNVISQEQNLDPDIIFPAQTTFPV